MLSGALDKPWGLSTYSGWTGHLLAEWGVLSSLGCCQVLQKLLGRSHMSLHILSSDILATVSSQVPGMVEVLSALD